MRRLLVLCTVLLSACAGVRPLGTPQLTLPPRPPGTLQTGPTVVVAQVLCDEGDGYVRWAFQLKPSWAGWLRIRVTAPATAAGLYDVRNIDFYGRSVDDIAKGATFTILQRDFNGSTWHNMGTYKDPGGEPMCPR